MQASDYAHALHRATYDTDSDTVSRVVGRLAALLRERGHTSLIPKILIAYERISTATERSSGVLVSVARDTDALAYANKISADVAALEGDPSCITYITDPHAIGGYAVRASGHRIDRTYKRQLIDLYRRLIISES